MLVRGLPPFDQPCLDRLVQERRAFDVRRGSHIAVVDVAVEAYAPAHRDLEPVFDNPPQRFGLRQLWNDVGTHGGTSRRYHPAILLAAGYLLARPLSYFSVQNLIPGLPGEISHREIGADIASPNVGPRTDESEILSCAAWYQTIVPQDFFDQAEIEIRSEPVFRLGAAKLGRDEPFYLSRHRFAVVEIVVVLVEL